MKIIYDTDTLELTIDDTPSFSSGCDISREARYVETITGGPVNIGYDVEVHFKFQETL